jgi:hypothetical protein
VQMGEGVARACRPAGSLGPGRRVPLALDPRAATGLEAVCTCTHTGRSGAVQAGAQGNNPP